MRIAILLLLVYIMIAFLSNYAEASTYSKREIYQVYCGVDKNTVTKKMKKLSRREIWGVCTGENKKDAPKKVRTEIQTDRYVPDDWILHNNKEFLDLRERT